MGALGQSGELELSIPPGAVGVVLAKSGHLDVEVPVLSGALDLSPQLGSAVKKLLEDEDGGEDQEGADEGGDQDEAEPIPIDVLLHPRHGGVEGGQEVIEDWGGGKND